MLSEFARRELSANRELLRARVARVHDCAAATGQWESARRPPASVAIPAPYARVRGRAFVRSARRAPADAAGTLARPNARVIVQSTWPSQAWITVPGTARHAA